MKKNGKKKPSVKVNDMRSKKNPKGGVIIKETIATSRMDKTTPLATSKVVDNKLPSTFLTDKWIK